MGEKGREGEGEKGSEAAAVVPPRGATKTTSPAPMTASEKPAASRQETSSPTRKADVPPAPLPPFPPLPFSLLPRSPLPAFRARRPWPR